MTDVEMTKVQANQFKTQWTEEKTKELLRLLDEGHTGPELARALGATKNAVVGKAHRLGRTISGQPYAVKYVKKVRPRLVIYRTYAAFAPEYEMFEQGTKPEAPTGAACDIFSLTTQTCHWPLWDGSDTKEKLYCGAASNGKTYCQHHTFMAGPLYRRPVATPQPSSPPSAPQ